MIRILVLLLLLAEPAQGFCTNRDQRCQQSSLRSLFSCCVSQRICKTPTGEKIEPGDTYVTDTGMWVCQSQKSRASLEPKACIRNGTVLEIGQIKGFGNFFFQCKVEEPKDLRLEKIACRGEKGFFARPGEEFEFENYVYLCDLNEEKQRRIKCCHETQRYEVGLIWNYKHLALKCHKHKNGLVKLISIGCVNDKGELITKDDDWFMANELQWRCKITDEGYYPKAVGCAPKDFYTGQPKLHSVGQTWYLRNGNEINLGYIQTCVSTDDGIENKVLECVYLISPQEKKYIFPGCAALLGDKAFTCGEEEGKTVVKLTSLKHGVPFEQFLDSNNLKICDVRKFPSVSRYIDDND